GSLAYVLQPRVARSSQPWAQRCNPVGIVTREQNARAFLLAPLIILLLLTQLAASGAVSLPPRLAPGRERALYFESNLGQTDEHYQFLSHGDGYSFCLAPTNVVLALRPDGNFEPEAGSFGPRPDSALRQRSALAKLIRMEFAGATGPARME